MNAHMTTLSKKDKAGLIKAENALLRDMNWIQVPDREGWWTNPHYGQCDRRDALLIVLEITAGIRA